MSSTLKFNEPNTISDNEGEWSIVKPKKKPNKKTKDTKILNRNNSIATVPKPTIPKIQDLSLLTNQQIQDKINNNILGPRFLSSKTTNSISSDKKFGPNSKSIEINKNDENVLKINAKQNTNTSTNHYSKNKNTATQDVIQPGVLSSSSLQGVNNSVSTTSRIKSTKTAKNQSKSIENSDTFPAGLPQNRQSRTTSLASNISSTSSSIDVIVDSQKLLNSESNSQRSIAQSLTNSISMNKIVNKSNTNNNINNKDNNNPLSPIIAGYKNLNLVGESSSSNFDSGMNTGTDVISPISQISKTSNLSLLPETTKPTETTTVNNTSSPSNQNNPWFSSNPLTKKTTPTMPDSFLDENGINNFQQNPTIQIKSDSKLSIVAQKLETLVDLNPQVQQGLITNQPDNQNLDFYQNNNNINEALIQNELYQNSYLQILRLNYHLMMKTDIKLLIELNPDNLELGIEILISSIMQAGLNIIKIAGIFIRSSNNPDIDANNHANLQKLLSNLADNILTNNQFTYLEIQNYKSSISESIKVVKNSDLDQNDDDLFACRKIIENLQMKLDNEYLENKIDQKLVYLSLVPISRTEFGSQILSFLELPLLSKFWKIVVVGDRTQTIAFNSVNSTNSNSNTISSNNNHSSLNLASPEKIASSNKLLLTKLKKAKCQSLLLPLDQLNNLSISLNLPNNNKLSIQYLAIYLTIMTNHNSLLEINRVVPEIIMDSPSFLGNLVFTRLEAVLLFDNLTGQGLEVDWERQVVVPLRYNAEVLLGLYQLWFQSY